MTLPQKENHESFHILKKFGFDDVIFSIYQLKTPFFQRPLWGIYKPNQGDTKIVRNRNDIFSKSIWTKLCRRIVFAHS